MLRVGASFLALCCVLVSAKDAATAPQSIVQSVPSSSLGVTVSSTAPSTPLSLTNGTTAGPAMTNASSTPKPTPPPSTAPPPTSTTTASPTTSSATSTTKVPTTSTASTTAKTPTSTTPATTPTTSGPPTTSTALPPPKKGHYVVKDENNNTCIMADLAVQVLLTMNNQTTSFDIPSNLTYSGTCDNETQEVLLIWQDDSAKHWSLTLQFKLNNTKFMVASITLGVPQGNTSLNLTTGDKTMFSTSVQKSYKCDKEQEIKLGEGSNITYAILKVSDVRLEAFHKSGGDKFSDAEDCASSSPDIVPIAVGCALVGLIAIVLVAFLVGRRRSQARGYLSM